MKFVDEYRNNEYSKKLVEKLNNISSEKINIMEVEGYHPINSIALGYAASEVSKALARKEN